MIQLNNQNINSTISSNNLVVLKFSAPWCGPCKALGPVFKELDERFSGQSVIFAEVDCSIEVDIQTQYAVRAVPTIIIIKQGEIKETIVGIKTKDFFIDTIKKYLN